MPRCLRLAWVGWRLAGLGPGINVSLPVLQPKTCRRASRAAAHGASHILFRPQQWGLQGLLGFLPAGQAGALRARPLVPTCGLLPSVELRVQMKTGTARQLERGLFCVAK